MLVEVSICIWLAINDSTFKKKKPLTINEYINIYNQLGVLSTFYIYMLTYLGFNFGKKKLLGIQRYWGITSLERQLKVLSMI